MDVAAGSVRGVDVPREVVAPASAPPAALAPSPAETPHDSRRVPIGAWIGGGGALVATGVASVFGVLTLQSQSDFNQHPTQASSDDFYRDRAIANVAWGAAVVCLGTAIVMWVVAPSGT